MSEQSPTAAHVLGEIAQLMAVSPLHQLLPLSTISWLVTPALANRQFYLFRDGDRSVGVAFWAFCSPSVEAKLEAGVLGEHGRLQAEDWTSGERLWLIDLVAPFATPDNRHCELMIADLMAGPLAGHALNLHRVDAATGERQVVTLTPDTIERLREQIASR